MSELPATRADAKAFYVALQARAQSATAWHEAQRWLGRNDLFYLLTVLLRRPDMDHDWLFDRMRMVQAEPNGYLDLWAREHGKDLSTETPVLTANRGWTTHGDIVPGDLVFAPDGTDKVVLGVTEHYKDHICYLITFSDDATIIAGAGHHWRIRRKRRLRDGKNPIRRVVFVDEIVTTEQMVTRGGRLDVGTCAPLIYPPVSLPIDPYVFGTWLGDGDSAGPRISSGYQDAAWMQDELVACGMQVSATHHSSVVKLRLGTGVCGKRGSSDVANALRQLGVTNNKHIPAIYMRASVEQRMALLQGLMDTDGSCNDRGTAQFSQAKGALAHQVCELAAGLGLQPHIARRLGKYKDGNVFWTVQFQAHTDRNPFRMPRKAARAIPSSHYRGCRTVAKIEPMPCVPTNCITVEDGLYCVGKELIPTHNSSVITFALTIQDILNNPEITVAIFSHTRRIAKGFLLQIMREFEMNQELKALYPDVLYANPGKESPQWAIEDGIVVKRKGNPKEPTIEAAGLVDSQPTSRHYLLRVYDDVVTRESVATGEQIVKCTEAWSLSQNLGVQEERGGRVRYIGTRYSLYDSYSEIIKRGAAVPRIFPATHNGRFDGEPVYFSVAEWNKRVRDQLRSTVAAQLLQNPLADQSATFRVSWLKSWDVRPRTLNVYVMMDPSRGQNSDSDNTAIAVIGIAAGGTKYFLDGFCHRMPLSERWVRLRHMYRKWSKMEGVQHIEVGVERYGMQTDTEYFDERMRQEKLHFPIQELNWSRDSGQSKQDRVARLEPDFRNGRIFLPSTVWMDGQDHYWRVGSDPDPDATPKLDEIAYRPSRGLTSRQMEYVKSGSSDLVAAPLLCRDSEGKGYDLTLALIDEYQSFPFGRLRDLIDAFSRIYDMEPSGPMLTSQHSETERVYFDA